MSIFKGRNITVEIFGESHSDKIGAYVKNAPKFTFDKDKLLNFISRRKATDGVFSTSRKEDDLPIINVQNDTVDGDFSVEILNKNVKSSDYGNLYAKPRPSHADYCRYLKDNVLDFSGGGRFSGRMTAPLCVVGGIFKQYLESKGIKIYAYISQIGNVLGKSYLDNAISEEEIVSCHNSEFPSLSDKDKMLEEISNAKSDGDSVGGVIECIVYNMPCGIGDNLFEGLEGKISELIYSVPAVKGVEFGSGFKLSAMRGSIANDVPYFDNGSVKFKTNRSGGINGGISNGDNLTLRVAVKPTPSISKEQETVDLVNKQNTKIIIGGRHDACIVPRAVPCIESAVAIAIIDEIL